MNRRSTIAAMSGAAATLVLVPGCGLFGTYTKKPKVTLKGVDVTDVDFTGARLAALIEIENRIPVDLSLAKINWGVTIDGKSLVNGVVSTPTVVPASQVFPVKLPFALKFDDLTRIASRYKDADEAPYRLTGDLEIETPVGPLTVPFKHDGLAPVLKVPQVELTKVQVRGFSFTGADVRFGFNIKNPNKMPLDIRALDYALTLAGARVAEGKLPGALNVAGKGSGTFDADVQVSFAQAQAAVAALRNAANAEYSLGGNLSAGTPWGAVSSPFSRTGSVKISK